VNEQEKNQNVQNENNNDTNVNYETFTIEKNSSNQQYIIHNFRTAHQQRPNHFYFLCPYEFSSKTHKINNIRCHIFNSEHPQYNTHNFYEFKVPIILVLQSYTIPSTKMTLKITLEPFVFCLHHGVQFLTSNQISLYLVK
jgi:predicted methyltransferase